MSSKLFFAQPENNRIEEAQQLLKSVASKDLNTGASREPGTSLTCSIVFALSLLAFKRCIFNLCISFGTRPICGDGRIAQFRISSPYWNVSELPTHMIKFNPAEMCLVSCNLSPFRGDILLGCSNLFCISLPNQFLSVDFERNFRCDL